MVGDGLDHAGAGSAGSGPPDEPSVVDSYKQAWEAMWDYFAILLLVWIVTLVLNGPSRVANLAGFAGASQETILLLSLVGLGYALLVGLPLNYGNVFVNLKVARRAEPELSDLFEGFRRYASVFGSAILAGLVVAVGFVLLILPGIWAALRLSMTPLLVVDRGLGALDAVKTSWAITEGHALQILGFFVLSLLVTLLGLLVLVVGVIPAGMWTGVAFADLYDDIAGPEPGQAAGHDPGVPGDAMTTTT